MSFTSSKFVAAIAFFGFVLIACAPAAQPTRAACPPRPTREPVATYTRNPHPKSPTTAPSPTSGPPPTSIPFAYPTLAQPLVTKQLVLQKLYEMELRAGTEWQEPWCVETLALQPGRIILTRYKTENEYNAIFGGWSINGNTEPVWVVTILGKVIAPPMPGWRQSAFGYLTYIVGEQTGSMHGMSAGQSPESLTVTPVPTRPPRTRKPRTPRAISGTPTATPTRNLVRVTATAIPTTRAP